MITRVGGRRAQVQTWDFGPSAVTRRGGRSSILSPFHDPPHTPSPQARYTCLLLSNMAWKLLVKHGAYLSPPPPPPPFGRPPPPTLSNTSLGSSENSTTPTSSRPLTSPPSRGHSSQKAPCLLLLPTYTTSPPPPSFPHPTRTQVASAWCPCVCVSACLWNKTTKKNLD